MIRLVSSVALALAVTLFLVWSIFLTPRATSPAPTPAPPAASPTPEAIPVSTPVPAVQVRRLRADAPVSSASGLVYVDLVMGSGAIAEPGTVVTVDYTGSLVDNTVFDTTIGKPPYEFTLGRGEAIDGWEEGIIGMRVDGERFLIVPPHLGYGEEGIGGVIPPNSILLFEVELLGVRR